MSSFWAIMAIAMIVSVLYMARGHAVFMYRRRLLSQVNKCSQLDILRGKSWSWRFEMWDTVTFDQMAHSWRPLWTFYPDPSFLDPDAEEPPHAPR